MKIWEELNTRRRTRKEAAAQAKQALLTAERNRIEAAQAEANEYLDQSNEYEQALVEITELLGDLEVDKFSDSGTYNAVAKAYNRAFHILDQHNVLD